MYFLHNIFNLIYLKVFVATRRVFSSFDPRVCLVCLSTHLDQRVCLFDYLVSCTSLIIGRSKQYVGRTWRWPTPSCRVAFCWSRVVALLVLFGWLEKRLMLMLIYYERKILLFRWNSMADKFTGPLAPRKRVWASVSKDFQDPRNAASKKLS